MADKLVSDRLKRKLDEMGIPLDTAREFAESVGLNIEDAVRRLEMLNEFEEPPLEAGVDPKRVWERERGKFRQRRRQQGYFDAVYGESRKPKPRPEEARANSLALKFFSKEPFVAKLSEADRIMLAWAKDMIERIERPGKISAWSLNELRAAYDACHAWPAHRMWEQALRSLVAGAVAAGAHGLKAAHGDDTIPRSGYRILANLQGYPGLPSTVTAGMIDEVIEGSTLGSGGFVTKNYHVAIDEMLRSIGEEPWSGQSHD